MSFIKIRHLLAPVIRSSQTLRPGFFSSIRPLHSRIVQSHKVLPSEFASPVAATVLSSNLQGLQCRQYSGGHGIEMNKHMLNERVMLVLRLYDKINPDKLTMESQFAKDLGLDSLDHVELIMAIEDEFGFEIPDQDAERLRSPADVIQYLCDKLDIFD